MNNSSIAKRSITEKDAENGISVIAASGLLIDDIAELKRNASSNILARLCYESTQELGHLHQRMTAFVEAMYKDRGVATFDADMQQAELVRFCDDDAVTTIYAYADCVNESSDRLMSSLRDMLGSENPLVSDAAMCYLEDAVRITRRLSSLMLSVHIANADKEEVANVPQHKVKP